jgi:hypothetical protein
MIFRSSKYVGSLFRVYVKVFILILAHALVKKVRSTEEWKKKKKKKKEEEKEKEKEK